MSDGASRSGRLEHNRLPEPTVRENGLLHVLRYRLNGTRRDYESRSSSELFECPNCGNELAMPTGTDRSFRTGKLCRWCNSTVPDIPVRCSACGKEEWLKLGGGEVKGTVYCFQHYTEQRDKALREQRDHESIDDKYRERVSYYTRCSELSADYDFATNRTELTLTYRGRYPDEAVEQLAKQFDGGRK